MQNLPDANQIIHKTSINGGTIELLEIISKKSHRFLVKRTVRGLTYQHAFRRRQDALRDFHESLAA